MAKLSVLAPFILSFEGGFAIHPADKGGPTNRGVTLTTWRSMGYDKDGDGDIDVDDLKLITKADAVEKVMRPFFWNRCKADDILSQAVANILVDWCWLSGCGVIRRVQAALGLKPDGIVGPKTLNALNSLPEIEVFCIIGQLRRRHIEAIVIRDHSQEVFYKGWLRRLNSIMIDRLRINDGSEILF